MIFFFLYFHVSMMEERVPLRLTESHSLICQIKENPGSWLC